MTVDTTTPEARVREFREHVARVEAEIGRVIVGQRGVVDALLTCLFAGGHALLEGVPGLGKTMLVRTLAECLGLEFSRIQFTPDLVPADVLGATVLVERDAGGRALEFRRGPVFAHVVLADEINRATPKTQSALLEVMQERSVTVSRTTHKLEEPYLVLATQNPLEMEGTYPLPEAQLDRFLLKVLVSPPSREELREILVRTTGETTESPSRVLERSRILAMRSLVREVVAAPHVLDYVARLVESTHPDAPTSPEPVRRYVRFGASPRGAQALLLAGKTRALRDGRFHVAAEDIRSVAHEALRHRLILGFEGQAEGVRADSLVDAVLDAVREERR